MRTAGCRPARHLTDARVPGFSGTRYYYLLTEVCSGGQCEPAVVFEADRSGFVGGLYPLRGWSHAKQAAVSA
jgi:hypothetical protein